MDCDILFEIWGNLFIKDITSLTHVKITEPAQVEPLEIGGCEHS